MRSVQLKRATPIRTHRDYLDIRSFASLDGLRAASILAVVWHHAAGSAGERSLFARGFLGVDFFFVISGFLIVTLLLRERRATGAISLRNFYVRRTLRIFPAYWLMLGVIAIVSVAKPGPSSALLQRDLPYALLYISNLVPMLTLLSITWSLSTEEQFYLFIPALQKFASRQFVFILPVLYALAVLPSLGALPAVHMPDFFRQTTFGPILLGVMLACVLDNPRGWSIAQRLLGSIWSPLWALLLVVVACSFPEADISGWPRLAIHATLVALLASCVVREQHVLRPLLTFWPVKRIGVVSYGIYLYHLIVLGIVLRALRVFGLSGGWVAFLAVTVGTYAVAEISYRLFESRFLSLKRRFATETRTPASSAVLRAELP